MSNSNLEFSDLTKFWLEETNKIKDYFNLKIKERKKIPCNNYRHTYRNSRIFFDCIIFCNYWNSKKITKYYKE